MTTSHTLKEDLAKRGRSKSERQPRSLSGTRNNLVKDTRKSVASSFQPFTPNESISIVRLKGSGEDDDVDFGDSSKKVIRKSQSAPEKLSRSSTVIVLLLPQKNTPSYSAQCFCIHKNGLFARQLPPNFCELL